MKSRIHLSLFILYKQHIVHWWGWNGDKETVQRVMRRVRSTMGRSGCRKALDETPDQLQPYVGRAYCKTSRKHKADMSQGTGTARRPFLLYLFTEALDQSHLPKSPDVSAFYKYQVCVWYVYTFNREASAKALNRENRLECIQQSIRVRFNH